jgi:predicted RecB family nuclease
MRLDEHNNVFLSPSDLTAYLACPHQTTLAAEVMRGERKKVFSREPLAALIAEKGDLHEQRHLRSLVDAGKHVVSIELRGNPRDPATYVEAHRATVAAMTSGADVIYQATFSRDGWTGRADFLIRVERPSDLGGWSYEPHDTKLARSSQPNAVLQLAWYAEEVARVQGHLPDRVHLVLGNSEVASFRPGDVAAFLRRVQRRVRRHVIDRPATYPWPCAHCSRCDFMPVCRQQWVDDDSLTRVASMRRDQITKLDTVGITTLTELGKASGRDRPKRLAVATFEALQDQAALQLERYRSGTAKVHLLKPEAKRGLGLLPMPAVGDVFFDMEGDPLFEPAAGLEFLFGVLWRESDGSTPYRAFWAHDRNEEKRAFEEFIDFVAERRRAHPDMHVYHYAAYEQSTLARLMSDHMTREEEVDDLLRGEILVDLYQAVRQGLRAGVESYSLKEIEKFFFTRNVGVGSGNEAVLEFERWLDDGDGARLDEIARYNRDDCLATLELRDWLLKQREEAEVQYGAPIAFRAPPEPYEVPQGDISETADLRDALLVRTEEGGWMPLLGRLLEYHKREARPAWWWHFARQTMTDEDLIDDGEALGGLQHDRAAPFDVARVEPKSRSLEWTFFFEQQQHHFDAGKSALDPRDGGTGWTVRQLDNEQGVVTLRRGKQFRDAPLPTAIVPIPPIQTDGQRAALRRVARSVLNGEPRYAHLVNLLKRTPPLGGASMQRTDISAQRELLDGIGESFLVLQGPPGSGKTYRGARLITHLIRQGRKVGIVAQSHKVIHNLLDAVERAATEEGLDFRGVKYGDLYESRHVRPGKPAEAADDLRYGEVDLVAGTAWLYSREEVDGLLDTLVVDEAGQFSLADAVACGTSARRLVLLGDPLQLAQVTQGVHPGRSDASVLEHVIGEDETIAPELGVFLEETRRLHPEVCSFISEALYGGRLRPEASCGRRATSAGMGVRWLAVSHEGNRTDSPEEVEAIRVAIGQLAGHTFTNEEGETRNLEHTDIMVVAPYNAQVRLLREGLPDGVQVGTVDKFQGREAVVAFYSMASSSGEDVPRGLDFLLSRNRLNVAVSRAQCLAYVVCSPRLLEVDCRTVEHLRLANALCLFAEHAERVMSH